MCVFTVSLLCLYCVFTLSAICLRFVCDLSATVRYSASTVLQWNFHGLVLNIRPAGFSASNGLLYCDHICLQEMGDKTIDMTDKKKPLYNKII